MKKILAFTSNRNRIHGCYRFSESGWEEETFYVPEEIPLSIFVNQRELVSILCSSSHMDLLVIGYLFSEGLIDTTEDIVDLNVCEESWSAHVILKQGAIRETGKRILTSGFGGGVSLGKEMPKTSVESMEVVSPDCIFALVQKMIDSSTQYHLTGGVHTTVLCDRERILAKAEDIGRHNTLDKVLGQCLVEGISTENKILMTTGRIASEILKKALKLRVPVVVSLSSPTTEAIRFARSAGVTLVGYVRGGSMRVYANPQRLEPSSKTEHLLQSKGTK